MFYCNGKIHINVNSPTLNKFKYPTPGLGCLNNFKGHRSQLKAYNTIKYYCRLWETSDLNKTASECVKVICITFVRNKLSFDYFNKS